MKTSIFSPHSCFVLLLCGASLTGQTERIQAFDSLINLDRDRTIHVTERIEIVNDNGYFDGGVHPQLRIKPASAERANAGSFDAFAAAIDGQPGTVDLARPSWGQTRSPIRHERRRSVAGKPSH